MWIYEKVLYLPLTDVCREGEDGQLLKKTLTELEAYTLCCLHARYGQEDTRAKALLTDMATECLNLAETVWALALAATDAKPDKTPCAIRAALDEAIEKASSDQTISLLELIRLRVEEHQKLLNELDIVL